MAEGGGRARHPAFRMAGRASWALADQGVSSFTNFAIGVLIASSVSATEFGAFSIAFATWLVIVNLARAVGTQPLVIRFSSVDVATWRRGVADATGTMIAVGIGAAVVCVAIGLVVGGTVGGAIAALGIAVPFLLAQDSWRFAFFAGGRDRDAFLTDLAWAIVLIVVLVGLSRVTSSIPVLIVGWGLSAGVGAMVGVWRSGVVPRPLRTLAWRREHADLVGRYAAEVVVGQVASQASIYVVGFVGGLAEAGSIRAAQILLGPMHIVLQAAHLIAVPEGVRIRQRRPGRFRLAIGAFAAGLAAIIVAWVVVLLLLPEAVGEALLGDSWTEARTVLGPLGLSLVGQAIAGAALVGLRVLADAVRSLRARIIDSITGFVLSVGGALLAGAMGASWGFALAGMIGAVTFWVFFLRSEAAHRGSPTAVPAGDASAAD